MTRNPLFWLHLRIGGSTRTVVLVPVAYATAILFFAGLSLYLSSRRDHPQIYATWLSIMTAAQAIFLLLLAPSAIRRSVQRDFESGMMESHRLTPMSNLRIVLGYLTGAPFLALLLCGVSAVFGSYFAARYGMTPGLGGSMGLGVTLLGWGTALGCMLVLAAAICAVVLLTAIATGGKTNLVGLILLIGIFGGWMAVMFIPGLALLSGVLSGGMLVGMFTKSAAVGNPAVIFSASGLQFVYFLIFLAACCAKLRHPERAVFSVGLGMILLLTWGLTLVAGMAVAGAYAWMFPPWKDADTPQVLASTAAFIVVALLPLVAAATDAHALDAAGALERRRSRAATRVRLVPPLLAVCTIACMALMQQFRIALHPSLPGWLVAAGLIASWLACALFFWGMFCFCYALLGLSVRLRIAVPLGVGVLLGGPLLLEGLAQFVVTELGGGRWPDAGYLSAISPVGTLAAAARGSLVVCGLGLVVQAGIAVGLTMWARRVRRGLSTLGVPTARRL